MHQRPPVAVHHPAVPPVTDIDRPYWAGGAKSVLQLPFCTTCSRWFFPPAPECPSCHGPAGFRATSGRGVVYTFTVSVQQFHPDVPTPFVVALIELDEQPGLRIPANILGCPVDLIRIGMAVTVAFDVAPTSKGNHDEIFVPVFVPAGPEIH